MQHLETKGSEHTYRKKWNHHGEKKLMAKQFTPKKTMILTPIVLPAQVQTLFFSAMKGNPA